MGYNPKLKLLYEILLSLMLTFIVIVASSKLALKFKPLYYYDIINLNISEQTGYTNTEIKQNYDYVVDYVASHKDVDFKLPSMIFSPSGKQHFEEVKIIYNTLDRLSIFLLIVLVLSMIINVRNRIYQFLKYSSITLLGLPLILGTFFILNFDKSFVIFHKIFFRNNMWFFYPETDPIITILPQEFFFHCAITIVSILLLFSVLSYFIYIFINNNKNATKSKYLL